MGPPSVAIFAVEMFCEQPRAKGHVSSDHADIRARATTWSMADAAGIPGQNPIAAEKSFLQLGHTRLSSRFHGLALRLKLSRY